MKKLVDSLEEGLLAFLLAFMTLLTFIQVVLRYVFNTGWVWSLEATTYAFAALVFIGMSYAVRVNAHIAVDLLTRKLAPGVRYVVCLTAIGACLVYTVLMMYGSFVFVDRLQTLGNFARDVPAPKWILTLTMPIGFLLLGFRFVEAGIKAIKGDVEVLLQKSHGNVDGQHHHLED